MLYLEHEEDRWAVLFHGVKIMEQVGGQDVLCVGEGSETISMHHGNFEIEDTLKFRHGSLSSKAVVTDEGISIVWEFVDGQVFCLLTVANGRLYGELKATRSEWNRFWLRLPATEDERVYGCGEQFSYLDLRGKDFPLWTREQGVGRNKATKITQMADTDDHAGGDYHTTFYPQTTFVSSRFYFFHAYTYAYADYDFSNPYYHELEFWQLPSQLVWSVKPSILEVVQDVSALLGRQPILPDWVHDGMILGIQDGTQVCLDKLAKATEHGVMVNGIWAQDWEGQNFTSFGKRLLWNWVWNERLYPALDTTIPLLREQGVRFLGYINPYVVRGESLCTEALQKGFLALNSIGDAYFVDFGEFFGGIVDFTNPHAYEWYKEVIKKNLIEFGLAGWMADFGEYLPTDVVLYNGLDAKTAHNEWPGLWARLNREAVDESGKADELVYFMRAGNADSLRYCPIMWAGDQNVDWSEDDGLPSVITSALSLAMSGMGLHHSDVGGYTTLYGMHRTKELFLRWAEFAACTPMMRSHEGNRPKDNWQFDSDEETLKRLAVCTGLFVALKEYRKDAVEQNAMQGIPVMRPLFLHYDDARLYNLKDEYLLGRDLLVAPVIVEGATSRSVVFPNDTWIHVWTGKVFNGGRHQIDAPLGHIPLFYRQVSPYKELFDNLRSIVRID
jgi:sulfoquinovosidase